ncbi:ArnT family glycosyltransferase [Sphingosinicella rhizophila]|uniref:Glycosyltransferase family 39 protein n=1 Tax=Sphingosinicella rhizophila TaxID=3050082 RepID=A0ABU3QBB6_9SPHN|nr:glycosyltransferase family 39 protein [Sphingosinicella sp. GR2756]MDT9600587.1 glycosyltransferase family 39 protein [Sphingosinicella sp. GR2756]
MILSRRPDGRASAPVLELAGALILVVLVLSLRPTGFGGGGVDDQRYFDAASAWSGQGPGAADSHWTLRWPFVAPLAGLFSVAGSSIPVALLLPWVAALAICAISFLAARRLFGRRVAWLWLGFFASLPLFNRLGTSLFPEMLELLFAASSLWCFFIGRDSERPQPWFLAAGVTAALAILTRETSAWLILVFAVFLLWRPGAKRVSYLWILCPALALLAGELVWFQAVAGDPLHRIRLDLGHIKVPSTQMAGGMSAESSAVLNPAVGASWRPQGLFDLHWALNPWLNLLADPKFGLLPLATPVLAWFAWRDGNDLAPEERKVLLALALIALSAFGFVTYVLMLSQDQRYYLPVLFACAMAAALLADRALGTSRKWAAGIVTAATIATSLFLVLHLNRYDDHARLALPILRELRQPVHVPADALAKLNQPLLDARLSGRVASAPAPPGALAMSFDIGLRCTDPLPAGTIFCTETQPTPLIRAGRWAAPGWRMPFAFGQSIERMVLARSP